MLDFFLLGARHISELHEELDLRGSLSRSRCALASFFLAGVFVFLSCLCTPPRDVEVGCWCFFLGLFRSQEFQCFVHSSSPSIFAIFVCRGCCVSRPAWVGKVMYGYTFIIVLGPKARCFSGRKNSLLIARELLRGCVILCTLCTLCTLGTNTFLPLQKTAAARYATGLYPARPYTGKQSCVQRAHGRARSFVFRCMGRAGYMSSTLFSQGYFEVGVPSLYLCHFVGAQCGEMLMNKKSRFNGPSRSAII